METINMKAQCSHRCRRLTQASRCRVVQPRLFRRLPSPCLRPTLCRTAATDALTFEELLAAGEASTPSTAPRPQRPQQPDSSRRQQQQQQQQQQRSYPPRQQRSYQPPPQRGPEGGSSTDEEGDAVPLESHSLKVHPGQVVLGRVINATPRGAKVLLLDGSDVMAYMPVKEAPYHMREADEEDVWTKGRDEQEPCLPVGLVREFRVVAIQSGGQGGVRANQPLLSARELDQDLMWRRASQVLQVCMEGKESLRVRVDGVNSGGLTSRLTGLNLFVPVGQLEKRPGGEWWSEETMTQDFAGQEISVAVVEVARKNRKVVGSITRARENDALRTLQVGCLVAGSVRRVEPFGAFVGIDGSRESGLIHISNISRQRVASPEDVFKVGERVKCVLMGMDPDYTNISLSTAELEPEEGAVLKDRQAVWDGAEEQAKLFRQHLKQLKESGFDFEALYKDSAH